MSDQTAEPSGAAWPGRQVYFLTVEWLDEPHPPESAERLAQVIRHAVEHGHGVPAAARPPASWCG